MSGPVLVVHGGAGSLPNEEDRARYRQGVSEALEAGVARLGEGARAAVLAAVQHMEAHTIMNAGRGAALAHDGTAALDAGFMDGSSRRYGAVTGVRRCVHPVLLAAHLADEGDYGRFVAPPDSDALVEAAGAPACEPHELISDRARALYARRREAEPDHPAFLDTVGAVALDLHGHLAAAVSTGGMSLKRPGRVGDSPVVGAGFWADDRSAAAVTTGVGEALLRQGTARRCVQLCEAGRAPDEAVAAALDELVDFPGDTRGGSGVILVAGGGDVVIDHISPEMSAGWARPDGTRDVQAVWRG